MSNLGDVLRQVVCTPKHIPDDWQFYKLTDICNPKQWKTISATEMTESGYPVFGANGFVGFYHEYNHENEAVAITCRGNTCGTINRIPSKTYITGNSMALDDIKKNVITQDFLYYALKYRGVGDSISGSAQPQITGAGLRSVEFPAPPLPEQQKIATILSSVDDVIEKTRAQIDKLKDLKTGMMQELLTKGIGHTEFKDSPVGRIPVGWEVMQLGKLDLDISDGNYSAKYPKSTDFKEQGVAFIRANNIKKSALVWDDMRFISEEQHSDLRKGHLKKDDIIITTRGEVGSVAMVTDSFVGANINAQIVRINTSPYIYPEYFYYYLQQNQVKEQIYGLETGTALRQLPVGNLKQLLVALPQLSEQRMIAGALGSNQKKSIALSLKLKGFLKIKKALMQDLLTGKVRVNLTDKESAVV